VSYYAKDPAELPEPPVYTRALSFCFDHAGDCYQVDGEWSWYEYGYGRVPKKCGEGFSDDTVMYKLNEDGEPIAKQDSPALWDVAERALESNNIIWVEWK